MNATKDYLKQENEKNETMKSEELSPSDRSRYSRLIDSQNRNVDNSVNNKSSYKQKFSRVTIHRGNNRNMSSTTEQTTVYSTTTTTEPTALYPATTPSTTTKSVRLNSRLLGLPDFIILEAPKSSRSQRGEEWTSPRPRPVYIPTTTEATTSTTTKRIILKRTPQQTTSTFSFPNILQLGSTTFTTTTFNPSVKYVVGGKLLKSETEASPIQEKLTLETRMTQESGADCIKIRNYFAVLLTATFMFIR